MGDEMLAKVCELAFEVAKEGDAPSGMANYLYLAHRPPRAYSVAQRALEEDPGFRSRVAAKATIENVGEAGHLWLHRPDGWEHRFAALNSGIEPIGTADRAPVDRPPMPEPPSFAAPAEPTPPPTVDSIELELSNLRNLVDRLADERQNVRSSVSELEEELETRRAENLAMSTHLSALRTELSAAQANEGSVAAQRDTALERARSLEGKIAELEASIAELEANTAELEKNVGSLTSEVDRLQSELSNSNAERDGALADLAEVSAGRDDVTSRLAEVSAERDDVTSRLADEQAGSGEQIAELTAANAQLTEDNTELASRVAVAEQARLDLEGQLGDVSAKWQEMSRELAQRSELGRRLETVEQERDQLAGQLGQAREQLLRMRSAADAGHEQMIAALTEVEHTVAPVDGESTLEDVVSGGEAGDGTDTDTDTDTVVTADIDEAVVSDEDVIVASTEVATDDAESGSENEDEVIDHIDRAEADADEPAEPADVVDEDEEDETDIVLDEDDVAEIDSARESNLAQEPSQGRTRILIPGDLTDEVDVARHVVSTPDVVLLIDGDGAAGLGWPHLDVAARRSALVNYLGQLTADTGAAADVVFERPVGGEEALPVSRAVRVRIADLPVSESPLFAAIVDGYPEEWPIAVVSDEPAISERTESMQVTHLANGQLLDLFLYLSSNDG